MAVADDNRLHTRFLDPTAYLSSIFCFIGTYDWYALTMNIEDSYEGAVRRLQRLEMAGIAIESSPPDAVDEPAIEGDAERLRQLEELATLACEDNERLKREFGTALQELDDARRDS